MESQQFPLPQTLLSGFLSTGKTVLHNHILHCIHVLKIAALATFWRSNRIQALHETPKCSALVPMSVPVQPRPSRRAMPAWYSLNVTPPFAHPSQLPAAGNCRPSTMSIAAAVRRRLCPHQEPCPARPLLPSFILETPTQKFPAKTCNSPAFPPGCKRE